MKRPRRVKVSWSWWEISWDPDRVTELGGEAGGGVSRADHSAIAVTKLPESRPYEQMTVLHEVLHAAWAATGLDDQTCDHEEVIVSTLAPVLLAVIRDNPDLIKYLTASE